MVNRPTWVDIDLDTLVDNVQSIRRCLSDRTKLLVTVKADAYGHGAVQVASAVADLVDCFGVATIDEGIELRESGIAEEILVLSPVLPGEIDEAAENGLSVTVSSPEFAKEVAAHGVRRRHPIDVHIEVDTGMGRTGFLPADAKAVVRSVVALDGIRVRGIFTHFPSSDDDREFTVEQIDAFRTFIDSVPGIPGDTVLHSANSGALGLVDSHLDMVRPGLSVYGLYPGPTAREVDVNPIMTWKSRLVQIRDLPAGATVSYGRTFVAQRPTRMGVVPVGYGHGLPFRLSSRGEMLVGGQRVPIIGRVTMDMTMIDLTDVGARPEVGDEVVIVGRQGDEAVAVDDVANWAGTISYEVLCGISKRVPRRYIRGSKVELVKTLLGVSSKGPRG